jgi:Na+(H+)/acetate symporter ActP
LPAGTRLVSSHTVDDFLVDRFSIAPARALTQSQITAIAGQLLTPPVAGAAVLVQSPHGAR